MLYNAINRWLRLHRCESFRTTPPKPEMTQKCIVTSSFQPQPDVAWHAASGATYSKYGSVSGRSVGDERRRKKRYRLTFAVRVYMYLFLQHALVPDYMPFDWTTCTSDVHTRHRLPLNCTRHDVVCTVSHRYGYGLMDAWRLVQEAGWWTTVPKQRVCLSSDKKMKQ